MQVVRSFSGKPSGDITVQSTVWNVNQEMRRIYLIGSLRNPQVPIVASLLRSLGYEVFDDWYAAGPEADDYWQRYETGRGHTYAEALEGYAAWHVADFDRFHLNRCDMAVLLMPAGKSGHIELGYMIGKGKPTFVLFDKVPERYDVMYRLATKVCLTSSELLIALEDQQR